MLIFTHTHTNYVVYFVQVEMQFILNGRKKDVYVIIECPTFEILLKYNYGQFHIYHHKY